MSKPLVGECRWQVFFVIDRWKNYLIIPYIYIQSVEKKEIWRETNDKTHDPNYFFTSLAINLKRLLLEDFEFATCFNPFSWLTNSSWSGTLTPKSWFPVNWFRLFRVAAHPQGFYHSLMLSRWIATLRLNRSFCWTGQRRRFTAF
jgi:hypothetical protein